MKTILITGINGFLGNHLYLELKNNYKVIGLTKSLISEYKNGMKLGENLFIADDVSLEGLFQKFNFDIIIHAATIYNAGESKLSLLNTNIMLPLNLLELGRKFNSKLFINVDSFFNNLQFDYNYLNDYTRSKKHCLEWIRSYELVTPKILNMKIFHMYGEDDSNEKFIPQMISRMLNKESAIPITSGNQKRDFIYVRDVTSAFRLVIEKEKIINHHQEFEIGTGKSISIKDILLEIKNLIKSDSELQFGVLPYRKGEIMNSTANPASLEKLGWSAKTSIQEGLQKTIDSYKKC